MTWGYDATTASLTLPVPRAPEQILVSEDHDTVYGEQ